MSLLGCFMCIVKHDFRTPKRAVLSGFLGFPLHYTYNVTFRA